MNTAFVFCRKNAVSFFSPSCCSNLERSIPRLTSHWGPRDRNQFFTNFRKRPSTETLIVHTTPACILWGYFLLEWQPHLQPFSSSCIYPGPLFIPKALWHFIAVPPLQSLALYLFLMIQGLYLRPRPMLIFSDSFFQKIFTPKKSHSKLQYVRQTKGRLPG